MKPSIAPTNGEVIETTTRRRTLTAAEAQTEQSSDFWEYVANVRDWNEHIVYIARTEPAGADGKPITFTKCGMFLTCPDGQQIPITDQEEIEIAFLKHCGGKMYRFFIKRRTQIVAKSFLFIDGPPKSLAPWAGTMPPVGQNPQNSPHILTSQNYGSSDPTAVVAGRAFDAMNMQERTAAEIGFAAMRTGLDAVTRAVDIQNKPNSSAMDPMMQQFLAAMVQRLTAPPPDTMQQMLQFMTLMREMNALNGGGNGLPAGWMEKVFGVMFEKFTNPQPTGAPSTTMGEVVRLVPGAIQGFAEVVREQRLLAEAQARGLALQRGAPPAAPPAPNPQVIPPAPPIAPNGDGAPSMDFVEKRIMQILQQPVSADQAADDALAFLDGLDPKAVEQLTALGETGLVTFFQQRPNLKPATANMGRLLEFIRAFIRMHAEDIAQAAAAAAPAAATQAKPN